ncbi:MAG: aspartate/glutamate racemase family protein [Vulcanisaeta sp. AZ3]|jgi:maleate isomerase
MKWIKIGLIIPSSNTTVEREFRFNEPEITVHTSRILLPDVTLKSLEMMERETERAAVELKTAKVDIIAYACTTGSLFKGPNHHEMIKQRIESKTGISAIATSGAVINALRTLGAKRVLVVTPYIEELNAKEKQFLEAHGFDVIDIKGLGIIDNTEIGSLEPKYNYEYIMSVARKYDRERYDALFISCTNWRTFEIINQLEEELNKPVISSNSATLWEIMKTLKITPPIRLGKLFKEHL